MLTQESGRGEQVCAQIGRLMEDPDHVPQSLEPDLEKLIALLKKNNRLDYLKSIFHSYTDMYYASANIVRARLVTAVPSPELEERISRLISKHRTCRIVVETRVDPAIVGGFILEFDDRLLDASVRRQIEILRTRFVEKNTRLV